MGTVDLTREVVDRSGEVDDCNAGVVDSSGEVA